MVLGAQAAPLHRSWCLFEVLQTFQLRDEQDDFAGLLYCTPLGVLNYGAEAYDVAIGLAKKLVTLDVREATASVEQDKDMIDSRIDTTLGFDHMNRLVRTEMQTSLEAVKVFFEDDIQALSDSLGSDPYVQSGTVR